MNPGVDTMNPDPRSLRWALALVGGVVLVISLLGASAGVAGAHPLGNYTVNHYSGIVVAPNGVAVDYVVDLAEVPTFQERAALDAAGSTEQYGEARCGELAAGLDLRVGETPWPLVPLASRVTVTPGQGQLDTMRLECTLRSEGAIPRDQAELVYLDGNDAERIGWREVTLRGHGVEVQSEVPTLTTSDRLTNYPPAAAGSVPRVKSARATLAVTDPTASLAQAGLQGPVPPADARSGEDDGGRAQPAEPSDRQASDPLSALIGRGDQGWWAMAVAIAVAAGLGALHGLAPGHGKTVVAAYLVGTRGSRRQAAALAATVALSHTSGVFILGGLTLAASATFPLERIYAWLQLASAAIVLGLGLWLVKNLLAAWRASRPSVSPLRRVSARTPRTAVLPAQSRPVPSLVGVGAHGLAAPDEPASLLHQGGDPHHHDDRDAHPLSHPRPHDHPHDPHDHPHGDHNHTPHNHDPHNHDPHGHDHDHGSGVHGLFPHRHRVAWDRLDLTQPLQWRALLALGLAGGLLPSASAVIVLLGAVQLGRVAFGAALILAFGVGLATALVGVGLGVVALSRRGGHRFAHRAWGARLQRWSAPLAAGALLLVGAWLTTRALLVL